MKKAFGVILVIVGLLSVAGQIVLHASGQHGNLSTTVGAWSVSLILLLTGVALYRDKGKPKNTD